MNNEQTNQVSAELENATTLSPVALLLEQLRITPDKQLPKMDFLFQLFGRPCFPRRELVAVTGKAKSGKTFVTSMLIAVGASPQPSPKGEGVKRFGETLQRTREQPLRVLWYDTEQSDESTQDILKNRIQTLIKANINQTNDLFNPPPSVENNIDVFNVRSVSWKDRRQLLLEAVSHYGPDLVIVDGIRDLVNDINDGVLAQEVMEELMHLADEQNCCIVCILHQNKGSEDHNLRGWIGTELMNKAFEVYACEKMMPQRIFKVEQTLTRKYDIEQSLYFEVDSEGLPRLTAAPIEGSGNSKERLKPLNQKYIVTEDDGSWTFNTRKLFSDALGNDSEVQASIFRERVMQLSAITVPQTYNNQLKKAIDEKIIEKIERGRVSFYRAAPF